MKVLVIIGDCVQINSSANLCHLSYIRGLLDAGVEVSLLSADGKGYRADPSMKIPEQIDWHTYNGVSLYQRLSWKKKSETTAIQPTSAAGKQPATGKNDLNRKVKDLVLSLYGVHGVYSTFLRRAKRFRSNERFDFVLSVAFPPSSHLLAYELLKTKHIIAGHWIQIWEDPWYADAYGYSRKDAVFQEERRLLSLAEKVCYVSPLTLQKQQRLFPESADKMYWKPLPAYYAETETARAMSERNVYGYFGDYNPSVRSLTPFYEAAKAAGIEVNLCGNPSNLFEKTEQIHIYPRLPLAELKPIEERTDVLVFLCNRQGGQIPGKIYQYSATGKTILFILDGTEEEQTVLRRYFEAFNRYIICKNTPEDIQRAIEQIESGEFAGVQNRPLDDFEPKRIITAILEACEEA